MQKQNIELLHLNSGVCRIFSRGGFLIVFSDPKGWGGFELPYPPPPQPRTCLHLNTVCHYMLESTLKYMYEIVQAYNNASTMKKYRTIKFRVCHNYSRISFCLVSFWLHDFFSLSHESDELTIRITIIKNLIDILYFMSVESQKGAITIQICFVENQKGAMVVEYVQQ